MLYVERILRLYNWFIYQYHLWCMYLLVALFSLIMYPKSNYYTYEHQCDSQKDYAQISIFVMEKLNSRTVFGL